ncbi:MAG TPA: flagellar hook capping FlgD N-terminal domain-containing protein [Verrucomicrobiae bacterium]|nr:flagellar hook capping FlgD N-terminal domain-containing protein [Verrucomicrobiae bacterium]
MPTPTTPVSGTPMLPQGNVVDNPLSGTKAPSSTLTQNDFLKLLVAQMSAQDPLNPQSNTDFAAQMAQFSALQTSQATQSDMSVLQASQLVQQANSFIGRTVTLAAHDGSTPTGIVTSVQMVSGVPKVVVNGSLYDLNQVLSISAQAVAPQPVAPAPITPAPPAPTQTTTHPANPYAS